MPIFIKFTKICTNINAIACKYHKMCELLEFNERNSKVLRLQQTERDIYSNFMNKKWFESFYLNDLWVYIHFFFVCSFGYV